MTTFFVVPFAYLSSLVPNDKACGSVAEGLPDDDAQLYTNTQNAISATLLMCIVLTRLVSGRAEDSRKDTTA